MKKYFRDRLNSASLNTPLKPFFAATKTDSGLLESLLRKLAPVKSQLQLIRVGPKGDGGYLLPDDLDGITTCFSPGVSTVSGFELECAARGMDIYMADASIESPPDSHPKFHFIKKFIGAVPQDEFITMEQWVASSQADSSGDWLLQIDIEGYEYEVFLNIPDHILRKFRSIAVEFHYLDYLFDAPYFMIVSKVFERLLQTHACVHIHPNNVDAVVSSGNISIPKVMEFTFHRRDRLHISGQVDALPHPLDADNDPDSPHLALPSSWYKA